MSADPQLRQTVGGVPYLIFSLAVPFPNFGRFEDKEEVCWPEFEVWGTAAENIARNAKKGTQMYIKSHLKEYVKEYEVVETQSESLATETDVTTTKQRRIRRFRVDFFLILPRRNND